MSAERLGKKIAFLGAGNMAGALVKGLVAAGAAQPDEILCTDVRRERLDELATKHGVRIGQDNVEAARWADVVVLATKPQVFDRLLPDVARGVRGDSLVDRNSASVERSLTNPAPEVSARRSGRGSA